MYVITWRLTLVEVNNNDNERKNTKRKKKQKGGGAKGKRVSGHPLRDPTRD